MTLVYVFICQKKKRILLLDDCRIVLFSADSPDCILRYDIGEKYGEFGKLTELGNDTVLFSRN